MRNLFWRIARFFLFRMDPENAHRLTLRLIRVGARTGTLKIISGTRKAEVSSLTQVFGMSFLSRVGLAAGFDKDAELVDALPSLGFGFAEIGTVTPRPQPGNERPRLFRDPSRSSLFNRMGFNGAGAEAVSRHLAATKGTLPTNFRIGVNLGKNKDTSLEDAASDYAKAASYFRDMADYMVINVSSPNTPGLRSLQTTEALKPIVDSVNVVIGQWSKRPPLLLKLAPELSGENLAHLIQEVESWKGIDGWILTNTLGGTIETRRDSQVQSLAGGWSGGAVTEASRRSLIEARAMSRLPIISVGGILSEEEALLRIRSGADLVQIYSGWIYRGPRFPADLSRVLAKSGK